MSPTPLPRRRPLVRPRFLVLALGVPIALLGGGLAFTTCMPGSARPLGHVRDVESEERFVAELREDVVALAERIGERNVNHPAALDAARDHVVAALREMGLSPSLETYVVSGVECSNVVAEIRGKAQPDEIVLVGAHYDSVFGSPGANDDATGVAALLALARRFARETPARTLRFVAFVNEEPPWFQSAEMGSRVHARACRARGDQITAMLSLETLGSYSHEPGSQRFPSPLLKLVYPSRGKFVAFVGNVVSRRLVRQVVGTFRESATIASEGAALPEFVSGVGWSDHESFWREGYRALMVTDTAVYRDPNYHTERDVPAAVDFASCARVVLGLEAVVRNLVAR